MNIDPDNPIVRLCAQGIAAEGEGRDVDAMRLYQEAWDKHSSDYEACIAAHYLARYQETPEEILAWNERALQYAMAVQDGSVGGFYPSLYLNMGKSYEDIGRMEEALQYYRLAEERSVILPGSPYADVVQKALKRALSRMNAAKA